MCFSLEKSGFVKHLSRSENLKRLQIENLKNYRRSWLLIVGVGNLNEIKYRRGNTVVLIIFILTSLLPQFCESVLIVFNYQFNRICTVKHIKVV